MAAKRDYYEILGVGRTASEDEIKRAYRSLAKKYHPDRNPGDTEAEKRFKEVQQAYSTLRDPEKRAQYDQFGEVGVGQWSSTPNGQKVYQWGGGSSINIEDLDDLLSAFGAGGGGRRPSIFEEILGSRTGAPRTGRRPQQGQDTEMTVNLSFMQAVQGATISLKRAGDRDGAKQTLDVRIPPGVEDGQRIRLKGRGQPGRNGGAPGDLFLVCKVQRHEYFTRHGTDVYVNVPVRITEAVLGAKIEVPTLDGTATVTLPPGTASGTKLRLANRGIAKPQGQGRGDQYIVVAIHPPTSLTDEQRKQFERLREYETVDPRAGFIKSKGG